MGRMSFADDAACLMLSLAIAQDVAMPRFGS